MADIFEQPNKPFNEECKQATSLDPDAGAEGACPAWGRGSKVLGQVNVLVHNSKRESRSKRWRNVNPNDLL